MLPYLKDAANIISGLDSNKGCPLNELLWRPVDIKLVVGCQVIFIGGVSVEL